MAIRVKLTAGRGQRFEAEIVTLPATVILPVRIGDVLPQLLIGSIFSVASLVTYVQAGHSPGIFSSLGILSFIFGFVGATTLAHGVAQLKRRNKLIFHKYHVEAFEPHLFRTTHWQEKYRAFLGVKSRVKKMQGKTFQIIELCHEDKLKTLPLYAARGKEKPIDHLAHYADILDVPIIE